MYLSSGGRVCARAIYGRRGLVHERGIYSRERSEEALFPSPGDPSHRGDQDGQKGPDRRCGSLWRLRVPRVQVPRAHRQISHLQRAAAVPRSQTHTLDAAWRRVAVLHELNRMHCWVVHYFFGLILAVYATLCRAMKYEVVYQMSW